jgi:hypothetical protein
MCSIALFFTVNLTTSIHNKDCTEYWCVEIAIFKRMSRVKKQQTLSAVSSLASSKRKQIKSAFS